MTKAKIRPAFTKFERAVQANEKHTIVLQTRALIAGYLAGTNDLAPILAIADAAAAELVAGVKTLDELLAKWTAHGYRPTLRGDIDARAIALADLYDFRAELLGLNVRAYRG